MAEETEISTPAIESDVTTSSDEVSTETTSNDEVTTETQAAETETELSPEDYSEKQPEEKLYAGKYKSADELEKGYLEAQKVLTQNNQYKAKYEELVKKQEQQEARLLERAKENGFKTVNDERIAKQVAQAEYDEFINGLNYYVEPDSVITVQQNLSAYYQTGDIRYLNEAKRYYPADFLERIAVGKENMKNRLEQQFERENQAKIQQAERELADTLRTDYGDFIEKVKANKGASTALEMFCNAGFIQSKDDMEVFKNVIGDIVSVAKEQAIKEYEAQKVIDATKQKATITADNSGVGLNADSDMPTAAEMRKDSKLYAKAVKKYGMDKVDKVLMKG